MSTVRLIRNTEWGFVMDALDRKIVATRSQYESISTDADRLPTLRAQLHAYTNLKRELEEAIVYEHA